MTKAITDRPLQRAGRKRLEPRADTADRIRALASAGIKPVGIARALGVSRDVFGRWMEEHPELKDAIDEGIEVERQSLHDFLVNEAKEKRNVTAAIFILKARHNYRDQGDPSGDLGNRINVTIALPGAMTMNQYLTSIGKGEGNG